MAAVATDPPVVTLSDVTKLFATIQNSVTALSTCVNNLEKDVNGTTSSDSVENPFAYPDGISLLTVKNDAMLDYLHHIVAICISKISGRSLAGTSKDVSQGPADLVQNLVKLRLMLEKLRPLENRLKYQMDKLLRSAAEGDKEVLLGRAKSTKAKKNKPKGDGSDDDDSDQDDDASDDDLAFRPNPSAFMQDKARALARPSKSNNKQRKSARDSSSDSESDEQGGKTAVYRPPKLVPMSYDPDARINKRGEKPSSITRNSALLSDLTAGMSSNPYEASSAGVGVGGRGRLAANTSSRAKALARMEEFEEENFTRLVMSKKDARKRRRDEADVALGGAGLSSGRDGRRRIGGGMEEEFGDLLRGAGLDGRNGKKAKKAQNAYDALRASSRSGSTLQRSKNSSSGALSGAGSKSNKFKNQVNRSARR
ncbi:related to LCP5 - U3 small nucleolar ribonucleoprotein involved in maturation of 18S rRNA [Melanopsichium pennsylvanicum]|uniref:Related to LCP5 - U3 small nucleolar ribonucleoprotein involved in maturation of 18S rRNA n=2 Tax=Melanopsichium pennsylvanicum TaxID=63383 RepID=A0AAJ4XND3_9BASI|nr:related to LCP5-U3 small nucleolar ribonucleoprotein involved in maturation of 18S rRNA [Melanopsichium pennsylvanicum 4]SNX86109.1 related to LCP5 - U3 small nucleolar ribonucleoprotein involved in maturation of 18S rRNA [Melanopsichium pennsylvanicum]